MEILDLPLRNEGLEAHSVASLLIPKVLEQLLKKDFEVALEIPDPWCFQW